MGRRTNRQTDMRARIAAAAARLMAEDGIDDFALAKRKAARQLGAADTQSLPRNDEIEAELRAYRALCLIPLVWQGVPLRLAVFDPRDERLALKTSQAGKVIERAGIAEVGAILSSDNVAKSD